LPLENRTKFNRIRAMSRLKLACVRGKWIEYRAMPTLWIRHKEGGRENMTSKQNGIQDWLQQLVETLEQIQREFAAVSEPKFFSDSTEGQEKLDTIGTKLLTVGELVKKIVDFDKKTNQLMLAQYTNINWSGFIGIRKVIVGWTLKFNPEKVFGICTNEIVPLLAIINKIIGDLDTGVLCALGPACLKGYSARMFAPRERITSYDFRSPDTAYNLASVSCQKAYFDASYSYDVDEMDLIADGGAGNSTSKNFIVEAEDLPDPYNTAREEAYKEFTENDFKPVELGKFSTFSVDVDTAAYSTMRRYINEMKQRPPVMSVRLEEYINYFKYDYPQPTDDKPFATHVDVYPCPWQPKHLLARIGIKGKEYTVDERPPLNLVFLIDTSGSMESSNRLPLVKKGLAELVEMLQPKDRVAIVTYAGDSHVSLPSVSGQEKRAILDSINGLRAAGSTYGAGGIKMAYDVARKNFDKEAQNRVVLCTDGDFNVGTTDNKTLEQNIGEEAKSGVFLTILGFGMGNYKDDRLKTLSMRGNGNYGYIDTIDECRRLLVEGLTGTLFAIAKDVKVQVDFNPAKVVGYRLLGYENRKLRDQDFHNDAVDAGEIGAGHTVTALYELVPVGVQLPTHIDKSRYATVTEPVTSVREEQVDSELSNELMFVKLRYKEPDSDTSSLLEYPVKASIQEANADSQFAAAVALYGMLLRSSQHSGNGTWDTVLELAEPNTKGDKYRKEFIDLVKKARESGNKIII